MKSLTSAPLTFLSVLIGGVFCGIIIKTKWKHILMYVEGKLMNIDKTNEGTTLVVALSGRLDTVSAPQLEAEMKKSISGIEKLVFDFAELEYLSSAGLRVLLAAQKVMNRQGQMIIKNVNVTIMEIFEVTGFLDILTIE